MKAIVVDERNPSAPLQLVEQPEPAPGDGEILISVSASGVNRADLMQRAGKYPPPPGASTLLGLEVSGRIAKVGKDVSAWKIGDEVCALLTGGGYAEQVVVPAGQVMPVPRGVRVEDAAGIPEAFITAYVNLFVEGALSEGERVLVHGGSSGVGTAAIQLARVAGCPCACTVGNQAKAERCEQLGAEWAINYKEEDFATSVREWCGDQGVDLVLDIIGRDYLERNVDVLAKGGRVVIISTSSGRTGTLDMATLMRKRARIIGSVLRSRSVEEKTHLIEGFIGRFFASFDQGEISPIIDSVFPVDEAERAHDRMKSSEHIGKIIISWK
jgi:putative PIG3 family NAD(P)H quinone oxidoreductase